MVNAIVLLKQVPGTSAVRIDETTGTMVRAEHGNVVNPLDEHALEEALRLKRSLPGVKVTVLSMGPAQATKALREALSLGADSAFLISDRAFAGSDTIATARVLAAALKRILGGAPGQEDLVLCGERATDGETGQVGPMVAAFLDLSIATFVRKLDVEAGKVVAERVVEGGFERLRMPLPALVTVVKDINQPGLPTLKGKLAAKSAPIPTLGLADLDLAKEETGLEGSPTRVVRVFHPRLARNTSLCAQDSSGRAVDQLLGFLGERRLI